MTASRTSRFVEEGDLVELRASAPQQIGEALARRRRRPRVLNDNGRLFLIAADHTARGQLGVNGDRAGMADRGQLLHRLRLALERPGVDGIVATADVIEDLAVLGALEDKVVFGSMNRGGLAGSIYELDDTFTGYTAGAIHRLGLDGGKMMVRISDHDAATGKVLQECADNINQLADHGIPAMVEVFAVHHYAGQLRIDPDPLRLARAAAVVSGLASTSAYTWLKLPVTSDVAGVASATTLPLFLLGGDPADTSDIHEQWARAMTSPRVRGLVAGRTILFPPDGDFVTAVDRAATIVTGVRSG